MKKIWIFGILVAVALLIIFTASSMGNKLQGNVVLNISAENQSGTSQKEISEAVLSTHNSESDCWVAYKGKVYDMTSWLQKHPGKAEPILPTCGTSTKFEEAFTKKHGTSKVAFLVKVAEIMGDLKYQGQISQ